MAPVALDYQPNQLASQQCFSLKKTANSTFSQPDQP
jgi:hypothetical protein